MALLGEALNYNSLTGQSDSFGQEKAFMNINFSDFGLSDQGMVTYKFNADIDPSIISYKKSVETASTSPNP